jgi:DNA-binding response OmpR family regulator
MTDKILIVDDDADTVRLVSLVLQRQGYQVVPAYEGFAALRLAYTEQPDLILLDVMMPGLDGYQVTRKLRSSPESANIPVLMFSARNQVDDRVAGYESGIDDYLAKPIHPAELMAKVKSLVSRSKMMGATFGEKGYTVGVIGAKGGIGVSSFVLNLSISYRQQSKKNVIAVELRPGHGSWLTNLNLKQPDGISRLLKLHPEGITTAAVNEQLQSVHPGIHLLTASRQPDDVKLLSATRQMQKISRLLPLLSSMVILDMGAGDLLNLNEMSALCDEIYVLLNSYPSSILRAQKLINDLTTFGFGNTKPLNLIFMKSPDGVVPSSVREIEGFLKRPVTSVIPSQPDIAFQAETQAKPLLSIDPNSELNQRYADIARRLIRTVQNRRSTAALK